MKKRTKVQLILFYRDANNTKHFLLLQTNKRRQSFWQNITGGVDENESLIEAAYRELQEETSIPEEEILNITQSELVFKFHDQWEYDVEEYVFFVELKGRVKIQIDPEEHQNFKWLEQVSLNDLKFESNFKALKEAEKLNS